MWRIILLGALGILIGTKARSERGAVVMSLFFGLGYGIVEVVSLALILGAPPLGRSLLIITLGLVLAVPVYAVAELWRRTRIRAWGWLQRFMGR